MSEALGDKSTATATTAGSTGNVPAYTITTPVTSVSGLTKVTNPLAASQGQDSEADADLRERIKNYISVLNQGTQAFYVACAQAADTNVLRALASKGTPVLEVDLVLAKRTGADFTAGELSVIETFVEAYRPAFTTLNLSSVTFTDIDVYAKVTLNTGYSLWTAFTQMADALAGYLDWSQWGWGVDVDDAKIIEVCSDVAAVKAIDMTTFSINTVIPGAGGAADVAVASDSLPKLQSLQLVDLDGVYDSIGVTPFQTSYLS
jgi:hypothetical protein